MALTITRHPIDRRADRGLQETHVALLVGDGTEQIAVGMGSVASITVGVAGTLLTLHDAISGDTLNDTNTLLIVATADVTDPAKFHGPPIAYSRGLRAVTTGAGTKVAVGFNSGGTTTVARRTYP